MNNRLCTKKLANRLCPDLPRKRLSDLCTFFNISNEQAHRAYADVLATHGVFSNFLQILEKREIVAVSDIIKFEKSPIRREPRKISVN